MKQQDIGGGGLRAGVGMQQPMKQAERFRARVQGQGLDRQGVAFAQFAVVGRVRLAGEDGAACPFAVGPPEVEPIHDRVARLIADQGVPGNVHVAVIIQPLRPHGRGMQAEWCRVVAHGIPNGWRR